MLQVLAVLAVVIVGSVLTVSSYTPPMPSAPDEALAACVYLGRVAKWRATPKEQSFSCELAPEAPPRAKRT